MRLCSTLLLHYIINIQILFSLSNTLLLTKNKIFTGERKLFTIKSLNPLKHNGKEKEVQFQKINPTLSKLKRKAGMHNYDRPM